MFLSRIKPNEIPLGLPPSQLEKRHDGGGESSSGGKCGGNWSRSLNTLFFIDTPCVKYKKNGKRGIFNMAFLFPGIDGGQPQ